MVKENNNIFDYLDSTKDKTEINNLNKNNIITKKEDEKLIVKDTILNSLPIVNVELKENNIKIENDELKENNIKIENDELKENNNLNKKPKLDRASLYEDYKTLLEGYYTQKKNNKVCINCNIDKILIYSEGIYACINCGDVERCIIENETTNYKDPMIEKPTFPYKRKNHFCEWIFFIFLTARKSINSYIW